MARSLIVLPDDSAKPILEAIEGASRTLRVKMFAFSDPGLLKAVIAAKRRGVKVRVMLNPARRSGEHDNDATRTALERADWHRHAFQPHHKSHLVWCPGPGRDRICHFIDEARHRLFVQNERFQDMVIIERLIRATRRGVTVDIMARPPHTLKREKLVEGVGGRSR